MSKLAAAAFIAAGPMKQTNILSNPLQLESVNWTFWKAHHVSQIPLRKIRKPVFIPFHKSDFSIRSNVVWEIS